MENTKLVELLKTFSKEELKKFEEFICSPYFNKKKYLIRLYKALRPFHPEFDNQNFTVENIYKKIYPQNKYDPKKSENILRVLSSEMLQLAKEFMKHEELKSQQMTGYLLELKSLRKKELNNFYLKLHSKILNECDSKIMLENDFFLEYYLINKDRSLIEEDSTRNIQEIVSLFNYFFYELGSLIDKSHFGKLYYNKTTNDNFVLIFLKSIDFKKILTHLEKDSIPQKDKDLYEYFMNYVIFSFNQNDDNCFTSLEKSFFNVKKYLDKRLKFSGYTLIINYYGHPLDDPKLYEVYKNLLDENIFEYPGFEMDPNLFRNIFLCFKRFKPGEELEFIEKYRNYLNPKFHSMYDFCKSEIELKEKNYKQALEYASKIEISSFILKYDIRHTFLKIYYSLNYFEEANCLIQSYRKFLRLNKNVPEHMEKSILKFLHFYEKLFNFKISNNIFEIKKLSLELEKVPLNSMWFPNWLRSEINELIS